MAQVEFVEEPPPPVDDPLLITARSSFRRDGTNFIQPERIPDFLKGQRVALYTHRKPLDGWMPGKAETLTSPRFTAFIEGSSERSKNAGVNSIKGHMDPSFRWYGTVCLFARRMQIPYLRLEVTLPPRQMLRRFAPPEFVNK